MAERERDELELAEELIRDSKRGHAAWVKEWDKMMKQLGIQGPPIGAKKLREMILKKGKIDPSKNEFSRGIIEMREE
jgi:hypothetical protein